MRERSDKKVGGSDKMVISEHLSDLQAQLLQPRRICRVQSNKSLSDRKLYLARTVPVPIAVELCVSSRELEDHKYAWRSRITLSWWDESTIVRRGGQEVDIRDHRKTKTTRFSYIG